MKKFLSKIRANSSFTLIELITAAAIFSILMITAGTLFAQVARSNKRLTTQNYIITEARFLMDKISREIQKSTIDYEQYYQAKVKNVLTPKGYAYGFGEYAFQFFDPGADTAPGYNCTSGVSQCADTTKIIQSTIDIDTGKHKYNAINEAEMEKYTAVKENQVHAATDYQQDELYLIDSLGKTRILFRREGNKLQMLKLEGYESEIKQDGINENWKCHADWLAITNISEDECKAYYNFNAPSTSIYKIDKTDFIDITPANIKITDLKFTIHPLEDPYKAFREPISLRSQPRVTIYITFEPENPGPIPIKPITLQTTISSQVYYGIPSYNKFQGQTW